VFIADIVPIIYYDGGKKSVSGEPLMIASIGSRRILGKSDPDPDCFLYQQGRLSCRDYNLRVVRLVSALPIAKTPNLIEVITHYDVE
jgi:hypothetical protein